MTLFFVVLVSSYAASVLWLLFGWARLLEKSGSVGHASHFISVIVPFRNEERDLPLLMADLFRQTYGAQNFEVIFVDDHSVDGSVEAINAALPVGMAARSFTLQHNEGKKAALALGVAHAKGEIIVTTDADCRLPAQWLTQMNQAYVDEVAQMVIGTVRIDPGTRFFGRLQALETASLTGVTGGTLGWGSPSMCSGANLSFRKSAFVEVGGYEGNENVASGDDEFLMRKIFHRWPAGIRFLGNSESVVTTRAQSTLNEFGHQRLRWAGKWRYNSSVGTRTLALAVWMFHLSFMAFAAMAPFPFFSGRVFLYGLIVKVFVEAIFLLSVCHFLSLRWSWLAFFFLQFFYSPYVVSIGFASQWMPAVWKGRSVTPRV
jgi:poly-beta-1,6-N-acetyl-D-glucosamine synthase